ALAAAGGFDGTPESLQRLFENIQGAFLIPTPPMDGSGVNWEAAGSRAKEIAKVNSKSIEDTGKKKLLDNLGIANLWLNEATDIAEITTEPKLLSRSLWVDDALPLFRILAEPVADRMNRSLSEAIQSQLPDEFSESLKGASNIMRSAGAMMFAMQLGQALGLLSREALTGTEIGLPIYVEQRPAFVMQNLDEFISSLDLGPDEDQAYIYLALRELAHIRLFKHSRWLREKVVAQIREYAAGISVDTSRMQEISEDFDPSNPQELQAALESGAFLAARSEIQQTALDIIETNLALIEGWVDAVTIDAAKRLPKGEAIREAVRRRRATGGPAERTFQSLVGLELRPKRMREASALWQAIGKSVGNEKRDSLWDHPDFLPTSQDIDNPEKFVAKVKNDLGIGDAMDQAIRDLLGDV
ncbi:MAG: zinc-dependent metalloprotease, partial [Acidobacteria bacterium]|nr:zinc-dependent metalloprotease [Acidobacteriota bacterium]